MGRKRGRDTGRRKGSSSAVVRVTQLGGDVVCKGKGRERPGPFLLLFL